MPEKCFLCREFRNIEDHGALQTYLLERPGPSAGRVHPYRVEGAERQPRHQPRPVRTGQTAGAGDELPPQSLRHEPAKKHTTHHRSDCTRHRDPLFRLHPERHRGYGRGQRLLRHHHHLARVLRTREAEHRKPGEHARGGHHRLPLAGNDGLQPLGCPDGDQHAPYSLRPCLPERPLLHRRGRRSAIGPGSHPAPAGHRQPPRGLHRRSQPPGHRQTAQAWLPGGLAREPYPHRKRTGGLPQDRLRGRQDSHRIAPRPAQSARRHPGHERHSGLCRHGGHQKPRPAHSPRRSLDRLYRRTARQLRGAQALRRMPPDLPDGPDRLPTPDRPSER